MRPPQKTDGKATLTLGTTGHISLILYSGESVNHAQWAQTRKQKWWKIFIFTLTIVSVTCDYPIYCALKYSKLKMGGQWYTNSCQGFSLCGDWGIPHHDFCLPPSKPCPPPTKFKENNGENNSLWLKIPPLVNLLWKTLLAFTPHRIPNESEVKVGLIVINLNILLKCFCV